jgi:hypothetical protein
MEFNGAVEVKSLRSCDVGELVRYRQDGHAAFAIVILKADARVRLGFIDHPQWSGFWQDYTSEHQVLSFGADWAVDIAALDADTWVGHLGKSEHPRVLHISVHGPFLFFSPPPSGAGFERFSLTQNAVIPGHDHPKGAPITKWRLWESIVDVANPRANPLIDFS